MNPAASSNLPQAAKPISLDPLEAGRYLKKPLLGSFARFFRTNLVILAHYLFLFFVFMVTGLGLSVYIFINYLQKSVVSGMPIT